VTTTPGGLWALKRPGVSVGTTNGWYVTAFTRENDVSRNRQTVLSYSCATGLQKQYSKKEQICKQRRTFGLKLRETRLFARVETLRCTTVALLCEDGGLSQARKLSCSEEVRPKQASSYIR
jgi:hypothetical protein